MHRALYNKVVLEIPTILNLLSTSSVPQALPEYAISPWNTKWAFLDCLESIMNLIFKHSYFIFLHINILFFKSFICNKTWLYNLSKIHLMQLLQLMYRNICISGYVLCNTGVEALVFVSAYHYS